MHGPEGVKSRYWQDLRVPEWVEALGAARRNGQACPTVTVFSILIASGMRGVRSTAHQVLARKVRSKSPKRG